MQLDAGKVTDKTNLTAYLEEIASDKGYKISDNQGSGDCMFYALSDQLELVNGKKISHGELRKSIVQYLKNNPNLVSYLGHKVSCFQWCETCAVNLCSAII